ncbi:GGDEF domain-containing protein [Aliikangiella coralliicola]|uniref:diguanylate cyclase n=1 Tax=Aliikangiella coralliicola TaxID=2592383 RepID=A0A545UI46_9GAMM|nr:GGDEF domain-containing protein [Aliikangiella coralliicola]TQV89139.1 GGDEF domain-containing protein [Aliikangiella coralliicola]
MTEIGTPQETHSLNELKRSIARLSYIGMGLSPEMDGRLNELRKAIKSDANHEEINQLVDKISKTLRTLEDTTESEKVEVAEQEVDLLKLLLSQRLPAKLKKTLKSMQRQSENMDAAAVANNIVDAIQKFLQQAQQNEKSEPGLLGRLFKRNKTELNKVQNQPAVSEDEHWLSEELKSSLLHLVDQLSVMDKYSELAVKLTEKVVQLEKITDLADILELITSAFVEVSGHEHEQFEKFLKSLNKRIDRVNEFIDGTVNYSQQVTAQSNQLDLDLQNSVTEIKDSFEASSSLTEVKQSLFQKMDSIVSRVNSFCEAQAANQQQLNQNMVNLREQLRATEDESSRLRDDLAAQRVRAQTDPLTQLPNRYSYNERLTQEYNRWRRYRSPLSLVVGDIDYFKKVNDEYGHTAGDEVLRVVALFLQNGLRESDFIARFGGEEFVILLPETSLVDATKAINKLRQGVKDVKVEFEALIIQVAMSFGIAEFENNDTPKAVFARADQALYRAKEKGRDQVCCQRAKLN